MVTAKEIYEKLIKNEMTYDDLREMADDSRQRYKEKFGEDVPTSFFCANLLLQLRKRVAK